MNFQSLNSHIANDSIMRHLFASKNHKNNKSLKLQKKLQLEEDRLWRVEQARRQEQELLDAEVARAIQEELEKECPLPPASDSALARRIEHDHERVNTSGRQSTQQPSLVTLNNNQVLSDEEFARRLQEEFDAEREDIQVPSPITPEQGRPVSTIPPALPAKPVAYHNTQHTGKSSDCHRLTPLLRHHI
ncbi:hypothetical protein BX666DRAFT_225289 [Dichotomocladium elegans]|nr:hypothetical protein BX666DRAFT_225289 [Dichotomocladium elegans]